jgi:hypothetical protein
MRHYINTNVGELSLARSLSLLSPMSPRPFGVLVVGTQRTDEFIFHFDGTVTSWSGAADYTLRLTIGASLAATPSLQTTAFSAITVPHAGWSGELALDSAEMVALLALTGETIGDFFQCPTLLTLEAIGPTGVATCYYQAPVILRALNYTIATTTTMQQNFFAKPAVTGLASATANAVKLGGLSTANSEYPVGSVVQLRFANNVIVQWTRANTTSAQAVPWIVRPYDYHATTNPYQWAIGAVTKDGQSCEYNADTGLWHYLATFGAASAVSVGADQTGFSLPA